MATDLGNMEHRLGEKLDAISEKLTSIAELETRVALLEQTTQSITRGLWAMFIAVLGSIVTYLFGIVKH